MTFETWLAFLVASAIVIVVPGPTVTLAVTYALSRGWRAAAPVAFGTICGDATALAASLLGVGALLAASQTLFSALKWIGAAYLILLGAWMILAARSQGAMASAGAATRLRMFAHGWIVTALNPRSITFFVAFLPQFITPSAPILPQALLLAATFLALATISIFGWTWIAARARSLAHDPRTLVWLNRASGATLAGMGAWIGLREAARV
jgi:threonine/homoserine/homoserine lactone efflux protein